MNIKYAFLTLKDVIWKKQTFKRIPNIIKVLSSFVVSNLLKKPVIWGEPFMLMLEPTNLCNLKCPLCIIGAEGFRRAEGKMSLENFKKLMDEIGDNLLHLTLWNQGEPFVNKDFMEMIKYAKSKNITLLTSTNGHFLEESAKEVVESGLDEIIISMDGASKESYEKYRINGNFNKIVDGMEALLKEKKLQNSKKPRVELQFIIMKHNEHEIDKMRELAKEWQVDRLSLKTVQVHNKQEADEFLPENPIYRRYDYDGENLKMRAELRNYCRWIWLCPVVNWDGTVSPCCFDKDCEYPLGDAFQDGGLKDIWNSKRYNNFRMQIFKNRKGIAICRNCSEGLKKLSFKKENINKVTKV